MAPPKAARPTSDKASKPRAVSTSAKRNRHATPLDFAIQATAVFDGQQCLGHVIVRGRDGFEAYDRDDQSIGMFPNMKAADAVSLAHKEQ